MQVQVVYPHPHVFKVGTSYEPVKYAILTSNGTDIELANTDQQPRFFMQKHLPPLQIDCLGDLPQVPRRLNCSGMGLALLKEKRLGRQPSITWRWQN